MDKVLKDLNLNNNNSKLSALFEKVRPNKIPTKVLTSEPGYIYQADLLFLPDDEGFKYVLTVVDTNNNNVDAEPLKTKNHNEVISAFKKIFSRGPLHYPKFSLETDPGSEFNNRDVVKYLNDKNIFLRVGARGRSNQQSIVEHMNGVIATILFMKMTTNELETGEEDNTWVHNLSKVISSINKHMKRDKTEEIERDCFNTKQDILPIGTVVRVALDKPINNVDGKRLYGKFRATDPRWDKTPRKIEELSLRPNQPVQYFIEGKNRNVFTRNQLQVVKIDENMPKPDKYIVEELIRKFYKGKIPYFEVKWRGYDDTTEEPRSSLIKDIPDMIKKFEKK